MRWKDEILGKDKMADRYGYFYSQSRRVAVDRGRVPENLWPLISYAEFWGVADDLERERLVFEAPATVLENLKTVVEQFATELDSWLAGSEADWETPSPEYVAFSAMRMAADFA